MTISQVGFPHCLLTLVDVFVWLVLVLYLTDFYKSHA